MKEKFNQMFKDKLFLVMLVLGLLTIVAAAGVITIQRGNVPEEYPYMQVEDGGMIAEEEPKQENVQIAGNANASEQLELAEETTQERKEETALLKGEPQSEADAALVGAGQDAAIPLTLNFTDQSRLGWPVYGNILLDYSVDSTIYFPTLAQYQTNPGVVIQAEVSQSVVAPANARVAAVSANEELGNYVVLDLGNDYLATCGQLKEVQVTENEYLEAGQLLGYVAEPTKYYSVEGSNVFFELRRGGDTLDPLDYLE